MIASGKGILTRFKKRWQLMQVVEVCLYALGPAVLVYVLLSRLDVAIGIFLVIVIVALAVLKPWKLSLDYLSNYIDRHLAVLEDSTSLVLQPEDQLSGLALLQKQKVAGLLENKIGEVAPNTHVKRAGIIALLFVLFSFLLYYFAGAQGFGIAPPPRSGEDAITFQSADSVATSFKPPVLTAQKVSINYPNYTRKASQTSSAMNITALEGSRLSWNIAFDGPVKMVTMEGVGDDEEMRRSDKASASSRGSDYAFAKAITLTTPGFYNFRFVDTTGGTYVSDLYAMEVITDKPPAVEIKGIDQFSSFDFGDDKGFDFQTEISDDYGIASAEIIATVSKGSGESVKFREEKLKFDEKVTVGKQQLDLTKRINLNALKMEPGDELYFYVEVADEKRPIPNITRSETYFAVIKDTLTNQFSVEGTMGADLMPDYFRSQRQLIIDTEKLIADKSTLNEQEFKTKSNDLGFDQKALRLKYGQFMGDEEDSGIAAGVDREDMEASENEDDPTKAYRHDHDDANEHNIVDTEHHDHDTNHEEGEEESPLEKIRFTITMIRKSLLSLQNLSEANSSRQWLRCGTQNFTCGLQILKHHYLISIRP